MLTAAIAIQGQNHLLQTWCGIVNMTLKATKKQQSWKKNVCQIFQTILSKRGKSRMIMSQKLKNKMAFSPVDIPFFCCAGFLCPKVYQCKYFWPIYVLHVFGQISKLELVLFFLNVFVAFSCHSSTFLICIFIKIPLCHFQMSKTELVTPLQRVILTVDVHLRTIGIGTGAVWETCRCSGNLA